MSDADELKMMLEERWRLDDERAARQERVQRQLFDEVEVLRASVRKLEARVDGASELASRTSRNAFSLEETVLAKLAFLQAAVDESRSEGKVRRTENIAGYVAVAVLVVVGALVAAHVIPLVSFVPTVGGLLAVVLATIHNQKRRSSGKSLPPPRG